MKDEVDAGTSAIGARSMSIPSACERCAGGRALGPRDARRGRAAPICGGDSVGGAHGIRLIVPPSWSTAIRSRGWPASVAARWSWLVSATRAVFVVRFRPKRITPPTSPPAIRAEQDGLGVGPSIATIRRWPTSRWSVPTGVAADAAGPARRTIARAATAAPSAPRPARGPAARPDRDGRRAPSGDRHRQRVQAFIWMLAGWPGPLHGGTVAVGLLERLRHDPAAPTEVVGDRHRWHDRGVAQTLATSTSLLSLSPGGSRGSWPPGEPAPCARTVPLPSTSCGIVDRACVQTCRTGVGDRRRSRSGCPRRLPSS